MSFPLKFLIRPLFGALKHRQTGYRHFRRWVAPTLMELKRRKDKMGPDPLQRRSEFIEWNYDAELYAFGQRLGENFDKPLLKQALIEESHLAHEQLKRESVGLEVEPDLESNKNLANNGGTFLDMCVSKFLAVVLPQLPNQYSRNIKNYLLSEEVLAKVSQNIGIDDLVLCVEFPLTNEILARNLKSVVQTLVISSGEDRAFGFVRDFVIAQLSGKDLTPFCTPENPLGELALVLEKHHLNPPEPRLIASIAKNTILASYEVGIYSDKKLIGRGFGESVEIAQDVAVCDALWRIWGVTENKRPFPFDLNLPLKEISSSSSTV